MLRKSLYTQQQGNLDARQSFSFSRLVIEATIATLVLSVFVASNPRLFSTRPSTAQARTVDQPTTVQPQI